jgi:hypothetical protein
MKKLNLNALNAAKQQLFDAITVKQLQKHTPAKNVDLLDHRFNKQSI